MSEWGGVYDALVRMMRMDNDENEKTVNDDACPFVNVLWESKVSVT